MATDQLMAPLPQIQLEPGFVIALEAIDPTTGLPVAGVEISTGSIYAEVNEAGQLAKLQPGGFLFMPGPDA